MTQKDEALRMAIEKLLKAAKHIQEILHHPTKSVTILDSGKLDDAIENYEAALSEPETYQVSEIQSFTVDGLCITAEQAKALLELMQQQAVKPETVTLPDGWVAVPVEPTDEMLMVGCEAGLDFKTLMDDEPFATDKAVYKAMIKPFIKNRS